MKTFCVSQKIFTQSFGYGIWSLLTIGFCVLLIASTNEIPTITILPDDDAFSFNDKICYQSFFGGEKCMSRVIWNQSITPVDCQPFSIVFLIIDFIVIGGWIYYKQSKFKFMWCENRASQSLDNVGGK